ncbi:AMIN domain-containing protein [Candidatus Desantisbacteria bacterium]|nr:AMIN domain-containing protein [Candidatus Desantisbacteria bacterium]
MYPKRDICLFGITRVQVIQQKGNQTRIIIGLIKSIPYSVNKIPNGLEVSITNPYSNYSICGIDIKEEDDRSIVAISTDGAPQYKYFEMLNPPRIIIDFLNATSDKVKDLRVDGKYVTGISVGQKNIDPINVARITVETKESVPYSVSTQGKIVLLTLKKYEAEKPEATVEKKDTKKDAVESKSSQTTVKKRTSKTEKDKQRYVTSKKRVASQPKVAVPKTITEKPVTTGQTISMDFKDADLLDVLRLIAHKVGVNIVPGATVKGIITLRLDNVPWETAMDIILKTQGYTYFKEGNIIRVDTKENLVGETMTRVVTLNYAMANEAVSIVAGALTPVGKACADVRTNAIIITDTVGNFPRIEQLIKDIDTETKQVMIEAKIVEVYLDKTNQLGFMWSIKDLVEGFQASSLMTETMPGGDRGEFIYRKLTSGYDITGMISAMVSEGKANVLSSPRIMTLHGKEAHIMVGEEIPYQQTTTSQAGIVQSNVVFRQVGVQLTVTPFINPNNCVTLTVRPEVSSFKGWASQTPILSNKSSLTQLLVKDGETVIIGGIIDDHGSNKTSKVPIFGDLPFIGSLFRLDMSENRKTELVIFITPHIQKSTK